MWDSICKFEKHFFNLKQQKDNQNDCLFLCLQEIDNIQQDISDLALEIRYGC